MTALFEQCYSKGLFYGLYQYAEGAVIIGHIPACLQNKTGETLTRHNIKRKLVFDDFVSTISSRARTGPMTTRLASY